MGFSRDHYPCLPWCYDVIICSFPPVNSFKQYSCPPPSFCFYQQILSYLKKTSFFFNNTRTTWEAVIFVITFCQVWSLLFILPYVLVCSLSLCACASSSLFYIISVKRRNLMRTGIMQQVDANRVVPDENGVPSEPCAIVVTSHSFIIWILIFNKRYTGSTQTYVLHILYNFLLQLALSESMVRLLLINVTLRVDFLIGIS